LLYEAGYIEVDSGSGYTLGPRVIELDRQIRLSDPLVQTAVDEMVNLARKTGGVSLLCRLYRDRVLCVHQERGSRAPGLVSYERGRAMPLYRGATSKAILAFLPPRALNALVERDRREVARAGLPAAGAAVHEALASVRERRLCISHGEVDPGAWGAAVPIIDHSGVIGSLSVVLPLGREVPDATIRPLERRAASVQSRAGQIEYVKAKGTQSECVAHYLRGGHSRRRSDRPHPREHTRYARSANAARGAQRGHGRGAQSRLHR
jgi:DNA-binding IclR family transcriptional regulator